ncbi:hypothetical protein OPS25_09750 [Alteromonas ponticola]|uniref:Uncharacterized protein n=1 Tax=Alteromonas aquimaris TaxID=2998417 RepID=A0ABT3P7N9_9ALTE|nr:hypothetical protein [Alteromonas aquimaris]MCW8108777.1 hypothetical protein [Alteromonas aquimaris]
MKRLALVGLLVLTITVVGWFGWLSRESASDEVVPVITVMDILHATDLQEGIKQGVLENDPDKVAYWLEKAKEVAEAAQLPASDLAYLDSRQAKEYVKFNAKRSLFNDEFEQRFYALKGIESLKEKYPEARDLFANAERLLAKRDQIVMNIASTLSDGAAPGEAEIKKAKSMWMERYQQQTENEKSDELTQ